MQIRGAVRDPALRNGRGIGAKDRFLIVIPLSQAHALVAAEVDRWVDLHHCSRKIAICAVRFDAFVKSAPAAGLPGTTGRLLRCAAYTARMCHSTPGGAPACVCLTEPAQNDAKFLSIAN